MYSAYNEMALCITYKANTYSLYLILITYYITVIKRDFLFDTT